MDLDEFLAVTAATALPVVVDGVNQRCSITATNVRIMRR
jgi:hypothetical protein